MKRTGSLARLKNSMLSKRGKAVGHSLLYPAVCVTGATTCEGAIQIVTGSPFTAPISTASSAPWDINGDAVTDFTFQSCGYTFTHSTIDLFRVTLIGNNGAGVVFNSPNPPGAGWGTTIKPVTASMTVGPGAAFQNIDCGLLAHTCDDHRLAQFDQFGLSQRDESLLTGVFGFRFDNSGVTNYGFAEFEGYARSGPGTGPGTIDGLFRINEWAYEDSGAPIHVFAIQSGVPEASSMIVWGGLAALAAGAAGIVRRRNLISGQTSPDVVAS